MRIQSSIRQYATIVVASLLLLLVALAPIRGAQAPTGRVVVASTGLKGVLIWDASDRVSDLIDQKLSEDDAFRELEASSIDIMTSKLAAFTASKTLTVRILYSQDRSANQEYGSTTFHSYTPLLNITVPLQLLGGGASGSLAASLRSGKPPSSVTITKVGSITPQ